MREGEDLNEICEIAVEIIEGGFPATIPVISLTQAAVLEKTSVHITFPNCIIFVLEWGGDNHEIFLSHYLLWAQRFSTIGFQRQGGEIIQRNCLIYYQ